MIKVITKYSILTAALLFLAGTADLWAQDQTGSQSVRDKELINAKTAYIDGLAAFENEDFKKAIELLSSAYVKLSDNPGVNFALADSYLRLDDLANAAYYGKQATKLDPQNRWYHLKLAEIYRQAGKNEATLNQLNEALKYHPNDTSILQELAQTYVQHGEFLKSNEIYNKILYLRGSDVNIHLQKLRNFNELNMQDSAIVELKKIRELDPDNLSTMQVLSNYYLKMDRTTEAKKVLRNALEINRQDSQILSMLADIYISEAKWDSVGILLGDVVSDTSVSTENKLTLTNHLFKKFNGDQSNRELKEATASVLEKLMDAEPTSSRVQSMAADYFVQTQQNELALKALEQTTELNPTNGSAWKQRLQLLMVEGKTKEAIEVGKRAAEEIPQDPIILFFLGSAHLSNQNHAEAVENLKEASNLPVRKQLKSNITGSLGDAHAGLENWEQAFESYEESLKLDPDNAVVLNNYAYYLSLQKKDLQKAEKMAQKAIELDPQNASFLDTIGWVYYQLEDYEKARKYLKASLDTGQASAEVMEHMGDVLDKLNQQQEAKSWWRKALEKDSTRTHLKEKISD
jgi:tetratricopeptide (TPR) repeat protein